MYVQRNGDRERETVQRQNMTRREDLLVVLFQAEKGMATTV
jgi:hypothetical protein